MAIRRPLALLALLALPALAVADTVAHPFAALPAPGAPSKLGLDRLQWGTTALSYSQSWSAGRSSSLGLLTKDLRVPLGRGLDFNARFGLAFAPGSQSLGTGEEGARFVLPFAALDWQPSENLQLRLEVGQGLGLYDPYAAYGWRRSGLASPLRERRATDAPLADE